MAGVTPTCRRVIYVDGAGLDFTRTIEMYREVHIHARLRMELQEMLLL